MKRCFALAGCLISLMSISCVEDPQETSTQDQALIFGTIDYQPIGQMLNDTKYKIGARYGRAVGLSATACSGFLIDDDIVVTARHCRKDNSNELTFAFGWWDNVINEQQNTLYLEALQWMKQRYIDLGLTPGQAEAALPEATIIQQWTCRLIEHPAPEGIEEWDPTIPHARDIDYWKCDPITLEINYQDRLHKFHLRPGMIWGHFNVAVQPNKKANDPIYQLGVNTPFPSSGFQTLLSPSGHIQQSQIGCLDDYQNCFSYLGADARRGHSGGPILDTNKHVVFGVFHGMTWTNPNEDGTSYQGYAEDGSEGHNIGTYLDAIAVNLSTKPPVTRPVGATTQPTTWYGRQRTGPSRWRWAGTCPPNTMAAGIIGNTFHYPANPKFDGRLGNLGLICLPHTDEFNTHFDRGVVVSPNTLVIEQQHPTDGMDFNTYVNEVYGYRFDTNVYERQHVAMCPPGYYMRGMSMSYDSESIRQINAIFCEHPESGHRGVTSVYDQFGTQIGQNVATPACANGSFITSIDAAKEWNVEGASFMCNAL